MRFKLDENLHPDVAALLRRHGHDAATVWEEGLRGRKDCVIAGACREEGRALVTLDLGFADPKGHPPRDQAGVVVLRLKRQSRVAVLQAEERLLPLFDVEPLAGALWVADETRLRILGATRGDEG